jgi:hypothetical protein
MCNFFQKETKIIFNATDSQFCSGIPVLKFCIMVNVTLCDIRTSFKEMEPLLIYEMLTH